MHGIVKHKSHDAVKKYHTSKSQQRRRAKRSNNVQIMLSYILIYGNLALWDTLHMNPRPCSSTDERCCSLSVLLFFQWLALWISAFDHSGIVGIWTEEDERVKRFNSPQSWQGLN